MALKSFALVIIGILALAASLPAHHSLGATYQADKTITLEGKIAQLLLRNPHSFLHIDVMGEDGKPVRWSLEWRSAGSLGQQGIKRDTLKAGEEVVITCNPSRTPGDTRGALVTLHRTSDNFGWGTRPGEVVE
jgi:hypothetical protein